MIANGVYAYRSLVHLPIFENSTFILDFVEVAPVNRSECHETFYVLHSSGIH